MKKLLALALVLTFCLAAVPMTASAGWEGVETYYAIKAKTEPVIDGTIDDVWKDAAVAKVEKFGSNIYKDTSTPEAHAKNPVASAEMKVMWVEDCIFVLGVVTDPTPNKTATKVGDEHIDGVDIQLSEADMDEAKMRDDTVGPDNTLPGNGIFNVNIDGKITGWGGVWFADNGKDKAEAAAVTTDTGYTFEIRIPLQTVKASVGKSIGLEFQINDNQDGTGRTAIRQWSCETCKAHANTKDLGTCFFVENPGETAVKTTEAPPTIGTEYIPETEPESSEAPSSTPAATEENKGTNEETKPTEDKKGCGSAIVAPVVLVAALMALPVALKRKED